MKPQELWDVFEEAYYRCPQTRDMGSDDPDVQELGYGRYVDMKKSYKKVITYWMDPQSVGGCVLHESGYINAVPDDILEQIEQYRSRMKAAQKQIIKEVFGGKS